MNMKTLLLLLVWSAMDITQGSTKVWSAIREELVTFNPFTLKNDQFRISPAASPEVLHHKV